MRDNENYPNFNARSTDPDTSHIAAVFTEEKKADRMMVWAIYKMSYPEPLATFEMEALLGGPRDGKWRKRRCDLERDKWLIKTDLPDRINPESNRPQGVYAINPDDAEHIKSRRGLTVKPAP